MRVALRAGATASTASAAPAASAPGGPEGRKADMAAGASSAKAPARPEPPGREARGAWRRCRELWLALAKASLSAEFVGHSAVIQNSCARYTARRQQQVAGEFAIRARICALCRRVSSVAQASARFDFA